MCSPKAFFLDNIILKIFPNVFDFFLKSITISNIFPLKHLQILIVYFLFENETL